MNIMTTEDIKNQLKEKYTSNKFRIGKYGKTIEIQNAHFLADKDWIIREPNYDYASREIEWYNLQSLDVNDIPGGPPKIWKQCADKDGKINSNYGWCIFSNENHNQFESCINRLLDDPFTREACMLYTRPSMQQECNTNGRHDFMCTYSTQVFLNEAGDNLSLDYTVFMRSSDAVFGYNNDCLWHRHVMNKMVDELNQHDLHVIAGNLIWNACSLHVYERHFKYLAEQ